MERRMVAVAALLALAACGGTGAGPGPREWTGVATAALQMVPVGVQCLVFTVTGGSAPPATFQFNVAPEIPSTFKLTGLPIGNDSFSADAHSVACSQVTASTTPIFSGGPVTVSVSPSVPATVLLTLQSTTATPGAANVGVDFPAATLQLVITEFPIPTAGGVPLGIATGSDGNLWFTETNSNKIGRITPAGAVTEFPISTAPPPPPPPPGVTAPPVPSASPRGIAAGPDGNLWFTESDGDKIGRITPAGVVTEFPLPSAGSVLVGIAAGPDGNLWFTESNGNRIGRITVAGVVTEFRLPTAAALPFGIAAGPDGNLWFTESAGRRIGRITPAGVVTEFALPAANSEGPFGITAGPDGNLWFLDDGGKKIGRITPAGAVTEFPLPAAGGASLAIAAGPDGNVWFAEREGNKIGRITPTGELTEVAIPTATSLPFGIAPGPDGNLWFTESRGNKIGRITP